MKRTMARTKHQTYTPLIMESQTARTRKCCAALGSHPSQKPKVAETQGLTRVISLVIYKCHLLTLIPNSGNNMSPMDSFLIKPQEEVHAQIL